MANLLQSCALSRTDLEGYPPVGYPYSDGMHMDSMPLDQEMQDEYGQHSMVYNSLARPYPDNY